MLPGEKLFWNVRAEGFQYSILLRANTADAELAAAEAGGTAAIGIGGRVAPPPLPHHRTCGSAYGGSAD
jgi:hypothetical protein